MVKQQRFAVDHGRNARTGAELDASRRPGGDRGILAPVVQNGVRGQPEGLHRIRRVHGRGFQTGVFLHGAGDHRADQHEGFRPPARPTVERKTHLAGESALQGSSGVRPGQSELADPHGLARRRPQGRRSEDCGAVERPHHVPVRHFTARDRLGGPLLERDLQRSLPVGRAVQRFRKHVHRAARQRRHQGACGPDAGCNGARGAVPGENEEDIGPGLERRLDLGVETSGVERLHLGLAGIAGENSLRLFSRPGTDAAGEGIDQHGHPPQGGMTSQRAGAGRRRIGRGVGRGRRFDRWRQGGAHAARTSRPERCSGRPFKARRLIS